jgi:hypothetical protein
MPDPLKPALELTSLDTSDRVFTFNNSSRTPKVFADSVQVIVNEDFASLVFGVKEISAGIDGSGIEPQVVVYIPRSIFLQLALNADKMSEMQEAMVKAKAQGGA